MEILDVRWYGTCVCLLDEVEGLLFIKAEKPGPVLVQVVTLLCISALFPVPTLKAKDTMSKQDPLNKTHFEVDNVSYIMKGQGRRVGPIAE